MLDLAKQIFMTVKKNTLAEGPPKLHVGYKCQLKKLIVNPAMEKSFLVLI